MREKKTIIILIFILLVGIIGLTVAYFSNTTSIDNLFSTKEYGSTIEEVFVSPDNWLPSDTTEKTVTVTNSGQVDEAVRISYSEVWVAKDGTILSGLIDENGNLTDDTENSERAAIINFSNNKDWTYSNGYYYYNYRLAPNETTSSLIDSVTFNSKVKNSSNCTTVENNGTKTITCNSTNSGYDGATYTLTFTIETVQYDKYMNAWNTDVAILEEQALFCDAFDVGEVVEYNNAEYYVLKDSSTSDDYVTLLKKDPLTASEVNQYSTDYVSQNGEYPYYESDTCNENNQTGCSTNYDTSSVKKIVDGWSSSFSDDLVSVDGYKTRLINENDVTFEKSETISEIDYSFSSDTPIFIHNLDVTYWTTLIMEDSYNKVYGINNYISIDNIYDKEYIRPVINLKKSAIDGACSSKTYKKYLTGDYLSCDGENFYVIQDRGTYVVLLKSNLLTAKEINQYSTDYTSSDGEYPFCISSNNCVENYETSSVKNIVDNWANKYNDSLKSIKGYNARLLTIEELREYFGYDGNISNSSTPSWITNISKYWSMNGYNYGPIYMRAYGISNTITDEDAINRKLFIRPVINMKKDSMINYCVKENENNEGYYIGKIVSYKNNDYCVIKNGEDEEDYVTLIKQEPLTYDELITYNNGYEIDRDNRDNNIGIMSYYKSDDCWFNSVFDNKYSGCSNDYNTSNIKDVVDNWSNSINNDLIEINGYKARLATYDELIQLGYTKEIRTTDYVLLSDYGTQCVPDSITSYWYIYGIAEGTVIPHNAYLSPVRPVINLKKCAITNTCE